MLDRLRDIVTGFWSLLVGLAVARKTGFEPPITEQYPDAIFDRPFKRHGVAPHTVSERYRGMRAIRWDWDEETSTCIACRSCERACPCKCIYGIDSEGKGKERRATSFSVDHCQCCFCGLCVEACPVDGKAIVNTPDYETVSRRARDLVVDIEWLHERGQHYHPPSSE